METVYTDNHTWFIGGLPALTAEEVMIVQHTGPAVVPDPTECFSPITPMSVDLISGASYPHSFADFLKALLIPSQWTIIASEKVTANTLYAVGCIRMPSR